MERTQLRRRRSHNKVKIFVPFDVQTIIIIKLPANSLVRFRSVSKQWKSLIDSLEFVKIYNTMNDRHLLARYNVQQYIADKDDNLSIIGNDAFPEHMSSITVPLSVKALSGVRILGSSYGITCSHGYHKDYPNIGSEMVVFWKSSIRKSVSVLLEPMLGLRTSWVGFGVCPKTRDPKLVKIDYVRGIPEVQDSSLERSECLMLSKWNKYLVVFEYCDIYGHLLNYSDLRKNGEAIIETRYANNDDDVDPISQVYDPCSNVSFISKFPQNTLRLDRNTLTRVGDFSVIDGYLDHVPFDIQRSILKKLPAKSLIRFRCVSNQWKSLIDNPKFIKKYHAMNDRYLLAIKNHEQHIADKDEFLSIIDNDAFPEHMSPITVPLSIKTLLRHDDMLSTFGNGYNSIVSFDLSDDEFGKVYLPNSLLHMKILMLSKWNECLIVFEYADIYGHLLNLWDVWMMKDDGVTQSFTMIFRIE
ncbi:putative F-box domain-containing protein [Tanacetum coccineum]